MESVEDLVLGEGASLSTGATADELLALEEHSWVQWYQKSWLELEEASDGKLVNPEVLSHQSWRRSGGVSQATPSGVAVKKGLIRFVYIVFDYSASVLVSADYKPSRADFITTELGKFISEFFKANPLSYVSLVAMRDGSAQFVTRINGQPKTQLKRLNEFIRSCQPAGSCSLVKALDLVLKTNSASSETPPYASREILVVWSSLASVDPSERSIHPYLTTQLESSAFSTTIISLVPEVFAVKRAANNFIVAVNPSDFRAKLHALLEPKENANVKPVYVKMGFPARYTGDQNRLVKSCCHNEVHAAVFACPQCGAYVCETPTNCAVCKLTLVDKDILTRVHRLLYDMPAFRGVVDGGECGACGYTGAVAECTACNDKFCDACEKFVHDELKHCPGCLTTA